ncbi:MAG: hypothetical protein WKF71_05540 [Pyrinomonadaceae bacterium]
MSLLQTANCQLPSDLWQFYKKSESYLFRRKNLSRKYLFLRLPTVYEIYPLTELHLKEVLTLNLRCFKQGENYTKYTFSYLLE